MELQDVNILGILLAGVASMVVGFVWYGPLFGKPWSKLMGWDAKSMDKIKKEMNMGKTYGASFVGSLVMAFVLAQLLGITKSDTLVAGAMMGFWAWLGFVAPVQFTDVLFGEKNINLFYINTGYQLASLLAMGAVLTIIG